MNARTVSRPVLRYHGGKWELARWIISCFPPHLVYVEPFGGGASVLLQKPRAYKEIYNELNSEVSALFRVLRDPGQAQLLIENLILTPYSRSEYEQSLLPTEEELEQARRLVVRSQMSFSSRSTTTREDTGFKTRARALNASAGNEWRTLPEQIARAAERLRGVVVETMDAFKLIPRQDTPRTLFYLDPPYPEETRNYYGVYSPEFCADDHRKLSELLHTLKGMCVLSGYRCEMYDELYGDWWRIDKDTTCDSRNGNRARTESLWLNPAAASAMPQQSLFAPASLCGEGDYQLEAE